MLLLEVQFDLKQLDINKLTKWYERKLRRVFVEAITEWVLFVEDNKLIPLLTGRAKGVYEKIIRKLRIGPSIDLDTVTSPYAHMLEYFDFDYTLGMAETAVIFREEYGEYIFNVITSVPYFGRWDTSPSQGGRGDWQSFSIGEDIIEGYLESVIPDRLPTFDENDDLYISTRVD